MKFPKKVNYMLILFLIGLNLLMRYPRVPHETGIDAFVMHGLANSISEFGYAKWVVNPLSWFGLYPLSYPSGGIFFTSGFSQLSNLPIEGAILIENMLLGIIGLLAIYLLAREIKDDDLIAFLAAFAFSLAPRFLSFTLWETPTRSMFMAITPLFIFLLLRIHKNPSIKNIGLIFVIFTVMLSAHRLAIIMLIILFAYLFTYLFMTISRIFKLKFPKLFLQPSRRRLIYHISAIAFIGGILLLIYLTDILKVYEMGQLFYGSNIVYSGLNLGLSMANSAGILLPFMAVGVIGLIYYKNKSLKEYLFIFMVLAMIPILSLRIYYGFYIITFTSLFIAIGLVITFKFLAKKRRKVAVILLVSCLGLSIYISNNFVTSKTCISNDTYNTGIYAKYYTNGTIMSNDGLLGSKISSISSRYYLPIGGATLPPNGMELLAFDFIKKEDIIATPLPLQELQVSSDYLFSFSIDDVDNWEWLRIIETNVNSISKKMEDRYNIRYAVERVDVEGNWVGWKGAEYSRFFSSLHYGRYKIYTNGVENIWFAK